MANIIFLKNKCFIILLIFLGFIIFFIWQNNHIGITEIKYKNSKIPKDFDDFTIVQISDLHNKKFGKEQNILLKQIKKASPDIIVITGDLIDRRKYNLDIARMFIRGAVKMAPVYYVSGNHEAWSGDYKNIKKNLLDAGVSVLDDEKINLLKENSKINIIGLSDPGFLSSNHTDGTDTSTLEKVLQDTSDRSYFQILLCHRPELFSVYADANIDLAFTGHNHGGQFRIPFIGGLVAPSQGLFPKYTSGLHTIEETSMIISRGLGNSVVPIRIFNRPEVIKVILKSQ